MIGEDAYEVSVARNRVDDAALAAHLLPTQPDKDEVSEGRPSWARSWEEKKRPKLTGTCSTWNKKGWGFIKRDDGASDVFVHQRSILQRGFRSLLEGLPCPHLYFPPLLSKPCLRLRGTRRI
mmetsp:Transcript_51336/g.115287  ORF Transcript_51336/g.115287 Transcript_51336/m.115287 type:complete len:122 (+) Transcript_51336:59-424(+)